ncbi:MAG: hypothetical protein SOX32_01270 [Candidatus Choladocola sp.]|nr:hypothetical protein [Candidatus Choladocola sp.]
MKRRTVLDGNAFYEIDEGCLENRKSEKKRDGSQKKGEKEQRERKKKE